MINDKNRFILKKKKMILKFIATIISCISVDLTYKKKQ